VTARSRTLVIDAESYDPDGYVLDATPPTITATPSTGVGTKTYSSTAPTVCTIDAATGVVTFTGTGTCAIGATIAADGSDGAATATPIAFVVTPVPGPGSTSRTLVIDADSYDPAGYSAGATPPTITSTPSNGGGVTTYSSTSPSVCTIDGASGAVTFTGAGACTIGATISADEDYETATAAPVAFTVTPVSRTLTIDAGSYEAAGYVVSATPPTITSTPSAGTGTRTYSSTTPSVCTIDPATGQVAFVTAGECTIGAAIAAAGIHDAATATPITFRISAPSAAPGPGPTTTDPVVADDDPADSDDEVVGPPADADDDATPAPAPAKDADGEAVAGTDAAIEGVVWFDRNGNGVFDGREWVLPGVTVTLTPGLTSAKAALPQAFPGATAVTGPDGSYAFADLSPGSYTVSASVQIAGFDRTSDGDVDWVVDVAVAGKGVGVADFAGLGRGSLYGTMFEVDTRRGMPFATVTCSWGGYDDVLGTGDDLPFEVTADAEGDFDMAGIPYGEYECAGVDGTGRTSSGVLASVFSPEPVEAPLPVGAMPAGQLPRTGTASSSLLALALGCLAVGTGLVRVGRRRTR